MSALAGTTRVVLEGKGPVDIRPSDHVATGGEASIFRVGTYAVKIYQDQDKMLREDIAGKIAALKTVCDRRIIGPHGLVSTSSSSRRPIGFYMPLVTGADHLARVLTTDYWRQNGFGIEQAKRLVDGMRAVYQIAHQHGAILVDANELNWMVDVNSRDNPEPRLIDFDSAQIGKWPAKVVMPSIRDWHNGGRYDARSDWFGFACVTFQVFTGVHPYKGRLAGYKMGEMERRMQDNASVFAPGARLSPAVRDIKAIPSALLDWYVAVLQHGERCEPPSAYDQARRDVPRTTTVAPHPAPAAGPSDRLVHEVLYDGPAAVTHVWPCGIARTVDGRLMSLSGEKARWLSAPGGISGKAEIVHAPGAGWIIADRQTGSDQPKVCLLSRGGDAVETIILPADVPGGILRYEEALYGIMRSGLTPLTFRALNKRTVATCEQPFRLSNPHAVSWHRGFGVLDAIGTRFLVLPFGDTGGITVLRCQELDRLDVVMGESAGRSVVVTAIDRTTGRYVRLDFWTTENRDGYTLTQRHDVEHGDLNTALLPRGVYAEFDNQGALRIVAPSQPSGAKNIVDRKLDGAKLCRIGGKVTYIKDGAVFALKLR